MPALRAAAKLHTLMEASRKKRKVRTCLLNIFPPLGRLLCRGPEESLHNLYQQEHLWFIKDGPLVTGPSTNRKVDPKVSLSANHKVNLKMSPSAVRKVDPKIWPPTNHKVNLKI